MVHICDQDLRKEIEIRGNFLLLFSVTHATFTFSKTAIETLEQVAKYLLTHGQS